MRKFECRKEVHAGRITLARAVAAQILVRGPSCICPTPQLKRE
jgi:hypothetical protein